jgi:glycosyltransferase involved in cell wall biosynthesis
MNGLRVAIVCDFTEEQWTSMQLVATMLLDHLRREHSGQVAVSAIQPAFIRTFSRCRKAPNSLFNVDRLLNRFVYYPALLRSVRDDFDVFHIIDHSYSHLVRELPAGQTIVTCHDLDTFRCLLQPQLEPRSRLFRAMVRRIMKGLGRAARVCAVSDTTRNALLTHRLVSPDTVMTIPNGVHPVCSPLPDAAGARKLQAIFEPPSEGAIDLLHVGSTIPRKRLDLVLNILARLREIFPGTRLLRVGGPLTCAQTSLAAELGVADSVFTFPFVDVHTLAAIYRRATLLLMPSDAEGFGLPAIEAMACGTPALLSDLSALREVAGDAAEYAMPGNLSVWVSAAISLLEERIDAPKRWTLRRAAGIERSRCFSWSKTTALTARLYHELAGSSAWSSACSTG